MTLGIHKPNSLPVPYRYGGLVFWLSAKDIFGDGSAPTNNTPISSCADKSGYRNNPGQSTVADQPIYFSSVINHRPGLYFNGTTSSLIIPNSPSLAITGDLTIFAIVHPFDYANHRGILSKSQTTQAASWDYYLFKTTGIPQYYRGNGSTSMFLDGTNAPAVDLPHILCVTQNATSVSHFLDANANGSGPLSITQADTGQPVYIGNRDDGSTPQNGYIGDILLYNRWFNTDDRISVMEFLGNEYGLIAP